MSWAKLCYLQIHMVPQKNVTVFGERALKVVIKVKLGHVSGPNPIQLVSLCEGEIMTQTCEQTQRKDQVRT